jgi:outer membrane protein OmpA-like peptidoglycan-associated protein
MRILITGFIVLVIWSFLSMWLYVDKLKPATRKHVVVQPVNENQNREADSLAKLYASMPKDILFHFDFDRSVILPDPTTDSSIDEFKAWMAKYPETMLTVTGHADFIGTPEYNLKLGMQRAENVKKFLVSKGIPPEKMITDSKGEQEPVASQITHEGRAMNRRTVVTIKK